MLPTLRRDVSYSFRMISKSPVVSVIAVISLALGIAANVSVFSLMNSWLLRPLPYPDADRLVMVYENNRNELGRQRGVTAANYFDWKEQSSSFDEWVAASYEQANLTGIDTPEQLRVARVTPNFFDMLGSETLVGRTFTLDEGGPDDDRVAVMGETVWRNQYGADEGIVGDTIILDGQPLTVVGVMPETFDFVLGDVSLWVADDATARRDDRTSHGYQVTGRLAEGVTLEQARADMEAIAARLEQQYPETNRDWGVYINIVDEEFPEATDRALIKILMTVVFLTLLVACTNVASLLLAKADTRQKEMAIRAALGAGRRRLVQQLLVESALMALVAGVLGTVLSIWGVRGIAQALPPIIPDFYLPRIDTTVIVFAALVSLFAGLIFGITPALQALASDLRGSLTEGGRGGTASVRRRRLRHAFVMAEFAMALTILVGAAVLTDLFHNSLDVNPGYDVGNVLTMELSMPEYKYPDDADLTRYVEEMGRRIEAVSGVETWAFVNELPRTFGMPRSTFAIPGEETEPGREPRTSWLSVTPDYLGSLRIALQSGRSLTDADRADAAAVIMINQRFADRFLDGNGPLGSMVEIQGETREIVGVVTDVAQLRLAGLMPTEPIVYFPMAQRPVRLVNAVLRTSVEPRDVTAAVRQALWAVDPEQPIASVRTLEEHIDFMLAGPNMLSALLYQLGILTLALASIGIYGVMAYAVSQQTREIGIRMALGAVSGQVLRGVMGQGMRLTSIGLVAGVLPAIGVGYAILSIPASIPDAGVLEFSLSPLPIAAVVLILGAVGLIASLLPARRATRIDPIVAFREE